MGGEQSKLVTHPVTLRDANAFVTEHHRHHPEVRGHKASVGVADDTGTLRGVAILAYPKARMIDRSAIAEVTRVATDGVENGCSALYGACCRLAAAHGFAKAITYTLIEEPGTSLRAAGWRPVAITEGGSWSREQRARTDKHPTGPKVRWECRHSSSPSVALAAPAIPEGEGHE